MPLYGGHESSGHAPHAPHTHHPLRWLWALWWLGRHHGRTHRHSERERALAALWGTLGPWARWKYHRRLYARYRATSQRLEHVLQMSDPEHWTEVIELAAQKQALARQDFDLLAHGDIDPPTEPRGIDP